MGRLLHQQPKRVLRELETRSGERLRVVAYRIPEPGYRGAGCGPRPMTEAHADDLLEGVYAAAVENAHFCWVLDQIEPGTCELVRADAAATVTVNGYAGARITTILMVAQRAGILPMLLRATEVRDATAAARFVECWRSPDLRSAMRATAPKLLTMRSCDADAALVKEMRSYGLPLRHKAAVGLDGRPVESRAVSHARMQLRRILDASSRITGG